MIKVYENLEIVLFNIASGASYVYTLEVQQCYQTGQKLLKNAKIQMRHFESFSNNVHDHKTGLKGRVRNKK